MTSDPAASTATPAGGSFWFTTGSPGSARPAATGDTRVDVAIVGGGFTGLWSAIALLDADPSLRVALLEADRVGWGASGRNGGFCAASLTHGLSNGLLHFPDELDVLEREGVDNLAGLVAFVRDEGIDCELEATGRSTWRPRRTRSRTSTRTPRWGPRHGHPLTFLSRDECRPRSARRASSPASAPTAALRDASTRRNSPGGSRPR